MSKQNPPAELAKINESYQISLEPAKFDAACVVAKKLIDTGFLPQHIKTPAQAVSIMLMGKELNLPPMLALRKIFVVHGTPGLAAELMLAKIMESKILEDIKIDQRPDGCTVTVKRKGISTAFSASFTKADAFNMGLMEKPNYKAQPGTMFMWRAVSKVGRMAFPDVIGGMHILEEIAPDIRVDAQGAPLGGELPMEHQEIIEATPIATEQAEQGEAPPEIPEEPEAKISPEQVAVIVAAIRKKKLSKGTVNKGLSSLGVLSVEELPVSQGVQFLKFVESFTATEGGTGA